ncbi:SIR2 family protein [Myxococcus sp. CA051A]|nr:SIR2 family protein [Myxococcus sp. CA051A]NTX66568.1 SIR2 family protein [Myxococcus sp. CA051A]
MQRRFSIDASSLPQHFETAFSLPWRRIYTLNIDDLELAAARRFKLPRDILPIQGIAKQTVDGGHPTRANKLEVVHLNGRISEGVSAVTFSTPQYAERAVTQEPWYARFAADLLSLPFVFIGTPLDEPVLWQHIEYRGTKGHRGLRELRPRSFLIAPTLSRARQLLLGEYNVEWIQLKTAEFIDQFLNQLRSTTSKGLTALGAGAASSGRAPSVPSDVSALIASPRTTPSIFLLGDEPDWSDIQAGRAIERSIDSEIYTKTDELLAHRKIPEGAKRASLLTITGTAGSGKSTAAMRLAMRLTAAGHVVKWVARETDLTPREIRASAQTATSPFILFIDDADQFGTELASIIYDISETKDTQLIVATVRSSKVDKALNPVRLEDLHRAEMTLPHLTDADIGALLDILDRENRLGQLKGKPRHLQEKIFRDRAGRQILVAMLEATSGQRFEDKVVGEWRELSNEGKELYALIAAATGLRHTLTREDLLVALGDRSNLTLNALDILIRRNIVASSTDGRLRARHRIIADTLIDEIRQHGNILTNVFSRLAFLASVQVTPQMHRSNKAWRFLKAVISHSFLLRLIELEGARAVYETIENNLAWESHYWLQRGSLEVEEGDLRLAENFIQQAHSILPDDPFVATEYGYMLFKKAVSQPQSVNAASWVSEALKILRDLINARGKIDRYPYHVLGSQSLAWSRRASLSKDDRKTLLRSVLHDLENGVQNHPGEQDLATLIVDVKREVLSLEVIPNLPGT